MRSIPSPVCPPELQEESHPARSPKATSPPSEHLHAPPLPPSSWSAVSVPPPTGLWRRGGRFCSRLHRRLLTSISTCCVHVHTNSLPVIHAASTRVHRGRPPDIHLCLFFYLLKSFQMLLGQIFVGLGSSMLYSY